MNNKKQKREDIVDESILEKHITNYITKMGKLLTIVFIYLFLADVGVTIFVKCGYLQFQLQSMKGGRATFSEFFINQVIIQVLTVIPFIIYFACYKKASFNGKKTLLTMLTITSTFVLCFGHWKNPFISFLFAIPVIIVSPLDSKRHITTLVICEASAILYAFYHNLLLHNVENNLLFLAIASTTIAMFYLVSLKIHESMNGVFKEVSDAQKVKEELVDKIDHDLLTGAYSKSRLEQDLGNLENYKSLAFLDIDNFKGINDEKGHQIGDFYLKLLVMSMKSKNFACYRYGGDEFVLLSTKKTADELKDAINIIRKRFYHSSSELYGLGGTISVGIVNINSDESADSNIQRGDKYMYVAKNNGRDRVAVEIN